MTPKQPEGIRGFGQITGDKYQATGVTQDEINADIGAEETLINNFRVIGQGTGNNFLIHQTMHITFNSNGTVTALVQKLNADCR